MPKGGKVKAPQTGRFSQLLNDRVMTEGRFVCLILKDLYIMLLNMSNPLLSSMINTPLSSYISLIRLALSIN